MKKGERENKKNNIIFKLNPNSSYNLVEKMAQWSSGMILALGSKALRKQQLH